MIDFDRTSDIADHPSNVQNHIDAVNTNSSEATKSTRKQEDTGIHTTVRVRGIILDSVSKRFIAIVNNRISFGSMTVMFPGGDVVPGTGELSSLAGAIRDELGISMELSPTNSRFVLSRTYETTDDNGNATRTRVNYYVITSDGAVPRNMMPESVISVSWLSLLDIRQNLKLENANWKIQMGGLAAIEAALDPSKAKITELMYREVSRQDGGKSPDETDKYSRPIALPYA